MVDSFLSLCCFDRLTFAVDHVPLPFSVVEIVVIVLAVLLVGTVAAGFAFFVLRKYRTEGSGRRVQSNKTIKGVMMSEYRRV